MPGILSAHSQESRLPENGTNHVHPYFSVHPGVVRSAFRIENDGGITDSHLKIDARYTLTTFPCQRNV